MSESTQHKLDRIRPPRVQITYDVQVGDAIEMRELPFVMGVIADLSGDRDPEQEFKKLKDRKFIEIDRDNFDEIVSRLEPRATFRVPNRLQEGGDENQEEGGEDDELSVELKFGKFEDFSPVKVLKQIEPMRKLYEARSRLSDLLAKLDGNDDLESMLAQVIEDTEKRDTLKKDLSEVQESAEGDESGGEGEESQGEEKKEE